MIEYLIQFWDNSLPYNKLAYILFPFVVTFYIWFLYNHGKWVPKQPKQPKHPKKHIPLKTKLNKRV